MKEPDIKLIRKALEVPVKAKFMGYFILNTKNNDFLFSFDDSPLVNFFSWTPVPTNAICFKGYLETFKIIKHFELDDIAIILMAFDFGSDIRMTEIPKYLLNS